VRWLAGNGHAPRLYGMLVLPVTAARCHMLPAIILDQANGVANLHASTIASLDGSDDLCLYSYRLLMRGASRGGPEVEQPVAAVPENRHLTLQPGRGRATGFGECGARARAFASTRPGGPGTPLVGHYDPSARCFAGQAASGACRPRRAFRR